MGYGPLKLTGKRYKSGIDLCKKCSSTNTTYKKWEKDGPWTSGAGDRKWEIQCHDCGHVHTWKD